MEGQWFVIQVMSGQEKKVKKNLEENHTPTGMADMVLEVVVPTENIAEVKRGEQKITEKRLWPGYALVKMKLTDDSWMYVKETNGVIGFLGGGKPVPLSEVEVAEILHDLQARKGEVAYKNKIQVGDNVKIIDGVFVNFMGTVEEVNHEKGKLSVMVSIFGRDTRVDDLEFWQVEETPVE
ncbi:MAG: transcription termination/antitermination protein NusG [Candidatus Neptunochlamydia sp.]|nr:transcription termination/antitermination protein NusG [Candidatus Neptunochlamydia sp.]